jgi:fatty acid desaturase
VYWLGPWLAFHAWLSTLTLAHHTAPHIPWTEPGPRYDPARAALSGTIAVPLPAPLEALINHANYDLHQHVAFNGVPAYHAKAATQALRERLWPYMHEAPLSLKLLTNHITKWQVRACGGACVLHSFERLAAAPTVKHACGMHVV